MIPVDFTPVSLRALEFAASLPSTASVQLHLVHVIKVSEADWACNTGSSETLDKVAIQRQVMEAEQQLAELKKQAGSSTIIKVLFGGLTTSLTAYDLQQPIDLIIMGTAGAVGWQEKLSGSTAQHVVRYAEIPLITLHQHASITPVQHILMVSDFVARQHDAKGLKTIKMLQALFNARLHLLQIIDQEEVTNTEHILRGMQQFAGTHHLQNYELHLQSDYQVPQGVRNFNEASQMDLVCIGTHARKGISHLFYGSIAETLVNRCIRPLLTYHI